MSTRLSPSFARRVPRGDNREREVCTHCGFVEYVNPRIVVGAVCAWDERILICLRAIEPRKGFWTLPAGFLEEGETVEEGVLREAREEARAEIELDGLLGVYSVPRVSQVQLFYRARLQSPDVVAAEETTAVRLAAWDEIPWDELAFPTVRWALEHYNRSRGADVVTPSSNPPGQKGEMVR